MREAFEQRASDLEDKYDHKLTSLREELDLRRKTEVHEVEEVSLRVYMHISIKS